jgi:hypothetical protein
MRCTGHGEMKNVCTVFENLKGRYHLGDAVVEGG